MTVDVRLGARLGPGRRSMRLPAGPTVGDLLAALAPDLERSPDELHGVAVAVQGEVVGRARVLRGGEPLPLALRVAGGEPRAGSSAFRTPWTAPPMSARRAPQRTNEPHGVSR